MPIHTIILGRSQLTITDSPPTFSAPPGQYLGLIAGGDYAIRNAVEGAEDSEERGASDLTRLSPPLNKDDALIGIAASGRTPYVIGGLKYARSVGAATVALACVKPSAIGPLSDVPIECVTGPEVVTGSTRLKAGTATKMVCLPPGYCLLLSNYDLTILRRLDLEHDFHRHTNPHWQNLWQLGVSI